MKTNYGTKLIASILGISMMFLGIYQAAFAYTYGGGVLSTSETLVAAVTPTPKKTAPTFTLKELAKYDGQNGHKAYVAVDGVVYDMTLLSSWKNGQHQGLSAGTDLTAAFSKSPHAKSILKLGKVVGTLAKAKAATVAPVAATSQTTTKTSTGNQNPPAATWTLTALKQYNGSNGNPAYIAVNGTIYDVSGAWQSGKHQGITAGQDVTQAFANSPHSKSLLSQLPVVGQIGKQMALSAAGTTGTTTAKPQSHINDDDHEDDDDDDHDGDDD